MAIHPNAEREPTYRALRLVRERALLDLDSVFVPGRRIWQPEFAIELQRAFVEKPDESADSFEVKLERQLAATSDAAKQLMAELLYVHLVMARDIKPTTKRRNVQTVLSWMDSPVVIPTEIDEGLQQGLASAGMGFRSKRPTQISYLVQFVVRWTESSDQQRDVALADPWEFKDFVYSVDSPGSPESQRNALLHLVHPETFEDIVSQYHKRDIVNTFGELAPREGDVDRALLAIRRALEDEAGEPISFYDERVRAIWQPAPEASADALEGDRSKMRSAWLIRARRRGRDASAEWIDGGYCAIGWAEAGAIQPGTTRKEITRHLQSSFPDRMQGWLSASAGNIDRFLNQMKPGDLVITPHGDDVFVGVVTSTPYHSDEGQHRRSVDWANPDAPIQRPTLSEGAYSKLRTLLTVSDVSDHLGEFARRAGIDIEAEAVAEAKATSGEVDVSLDRVSEAFARELHLPAEWLNDLVDLLEEKRQVIFYGPPGTGKTFVAQRLADHLSEAEGSTLVQFHPSYAYEDFFEGFRPLATAEDSGITFELVPGPLRRIADAAREDRTKPYILIIDEINRANIAKVFGELYFLLEYRDRAIALQYGGESEFSIPKNLFIIGTMNTADRSIAFVDAAMRRRFYFVPFFPRSHPIDGVLPSWLTEHSMDPLPARLLSALNDRIDDDDFSVGPSYLMTSRASDRGGLHRIWDHAVLPLLEEHYFGSGRDVEAEFGLDRLLSDIERSSDPTMSDDASA